MLEMLLKIFFTKEKRGTKPYTPPTFEISVYDFEARERFYKAIFSERNLR